MKYDMYGMTEEELKEWLCSHNEPSFRAVQIQEWLWKKRAASFSDMKNIGKKTQEVLADSFCIGSLSLEKMELSDTKETTKFLWRLHDGARVESVLIRAPGRKTVCVSTQVGCPARCSFCASGRKGLIRNLTAGEIVSQMMGVDSFLHQNGEKGIDHVVYMGMGEPLENYDEVLRSIRIVTNPNQGALSQRRITLSTVGVIEGLTRLLGEGWLRINLALSLHAPNQVIRQKIIPYARRYDIRDILSLVAQYQELSGRDVTYEYILIEGINDDSLQAQELAALLKGKKGSVNLIPYNPNPNLPYKRPSRERVEAFQKELNQAHIHSTCRYTKGDDIAAACGQLALFEGG